MKTSGFIVFLSIVLLVYLFINLYIFRRAWQAFSFPAVWRFFGLALLLMLMLAYPLGRFGEQLSRNGVTNFLVTVGSFYLGLMIYAFFMVALIDLLRLGNHAIHFLPAALVQNPLKTARITALMVAGFTVIVVFVGHLNALHPRVRQLQIQIDKPAGELKELNMVVASDIHLGTIIRNSRLVKIVEMINRLHPDIVLLPGDVFDEDVAPVAEQNIAEILEKIHSRYGVFAITGNHEYYGGVQSAVSYMKQARITVLQDSAVKIADSFYLIGRNDLTARQMGLSRKPLPEILAGTDRRLPLILMDHQPFHLEVAQQNGIDLQLSGHTHHGQMFPFNLITNRVYEKSWGYLRRGKTQYYISCGVGTWGPPVRLGNRPEIVHIRLRFAETE